MSRVGMALFVGLISQGCTGLTQAPPPSAAPASPRSYQRFVPAATSDRDFALDTKTGKLCKTWNWTLADSPLNKLSECIELYNEFPDSAAPPNLSLGAQ